MKEQKPKASNKQITLFIIGALIGIILGLLIFKPLLIDAPGHFELPEPQPTMSKVVHSVL